MKKTLLTIAFTVASSWASFAQYTLIPKAGIALGSYSYDGEAEKSNLGLTLGVGLNLPLVENGLFSVQPELNFIQKGSKYKEDGYVEKFWLNYLEVPILAKVNFGTETIRAYVNAGPSVGFALNGGGKSKDGRDTQTYKIKFGDKESTDDTFYMDSNEVNRVDVGLQLGVGVGLQTGPGALLLDVRSVLGLTNFEKSAGGKSRTVALTLGYALPIGN